MCLHDKRDSWIKGIIGMDSFVLLSADQMRELVKSAKNGDELAKEKLIQGNYPLIKSVVKHYLNKGVDYDDLYQIGMLGFLKAINNFDENFDVKFSTYAVPMINGEIKRFLRDDGIIKVSRAIKTLALKVKRFIEDYQKQNNTMPQISTIAKALEAEEEDVIMAMESSRTLISIDAKIDEADNNSGLVVDKLIVGDDTEKLIDNIALKQAIKTLPEREKKILLLRYFRDKTQSEVAQIMQVSQVQISRIESKILQTLKSYMK